MQALSIFLPFVGVGMSPFDERLERFLEAGEPPVYLGWGSMCRLHNDELCRAAIKACMICKKRGIILGEPKAYTVRMESTATESDENCL